MFIYFVLSDKLNTYFYIKCTKLYCIWMSSRDRKPAKTAYSKDFKAVFCQICNVIRIKIENRFCSQLLRLIAKVAETTYVLPTDRTAPGVFLCEDLLLCVKGCPIRQGLQEFSRTVVVSTTTCGENGSMCEMLLRIIQFSLIVRHIL